MKKEEICMFTCDFCGHKCMDETAMKLHEEICPKNPKNQPCSECENCIISSHGAGAICSNNIDMEQIKDKVVCFCYKKGNPMII